MWRDNEIHVNDRLARKLTILNKDGLCVRPLALLVKTVAMHGRHTEVLVTCGEATVSGRSFMGILTLGAMQGREILVEARGPKARVVLEAITALVNAGFFSGEPCLPIPPSHLEFIELPPKVEDGSAA